MAMRLSSSLLDLRELLYSAFDTYDSLVEENFGRKNRT